MSNLDPALEAQLAQLAIPLAIEAIKYLADRVQNQATALQEASLEKRATDAAADAALVAKYGPGAADGL